MRLFFCSLLCLFLISNLNSQTNGGETFITIGNQKIPVTEFERIFNKNNSIPTAEKQTLDEYLQMFINFKLKVQAAMDAGYHTLPSFTGELKGYRDQLAKSYLVDNSAIDSLVKEAYQRMHTEVSASHIMASLKVNASPLDTMEAWNKIMDIRGRLLNGEDFEKLAYELSEDPSAKNNKGNLGYFTAFQMVYPFESAAYNCKDGEISQPVRSQFGYHILKTNDKRPARGEVKVAHIMLMVPQGSSDTSWIAAGKKIKEIAAQLKSGADFATLAREKSEDRGSARLGGELPMFGTGRMVPEFEDAAFKLKTPGEISEPVRTFYGWHIIKLIEKKGIPDFEQVKQEIKSKISRDQRAEYGSISFVNGLKKEYGFKENLALLSEFYDNPGEAPGSISELPKKQPRKTAPNAKAVSSPNQAPGTSKKLKYSISPEKAGETLFSFADKSFKLEQFGNYLKNLPQPDSTVAIENFLRKAYNNFVKDQMLRYEDSQLETKYPDFKNLVQEYHDGILLFNMSDSLVWSKASKDTVGLEQFFKVNQTHYQWPERAEATVIQCLTPEIATKATKAAKKLGTPQKLQSELLKTVCDTSAKEPCVKLEYNKFAKGDHKAVDTIIWEKGVSKVVVAEGKYCFVVVHNLLKPTPKTLEESRGMAISDYQAFLEKEWVTALRKQYNVVINNAILNQLKTKYEGNN